MTRLETFATTYTGFGAPKSSWFNNLRAEMANRPFDPYFTTYDMMNQIVKESGGVWTYAEAKNNRVPIWPEYLDFEDEQQASLFLLRWM